VNDATSESAETVTLTLASSASYVVDATKKTGTVTIAAN
jgi:hypothetical protein